jgi:hypothetical protein
VLATGFTLLFTSSGTALCSRLISPCSPLLVCAFEIPATFASASDIAFASSSCPSTASFSCSSAGTSFALAFPICVSKAASCASSPRICLAAFCCDALNLCVSPVGAAAVSTPGFTWIRASSAASSRAD